MKNNPLKKALDELDSLLSIKKLDLEIIICGAYAIQLLGFERGTHTLDVDTLNKITNPKVLDAIREVAVKTGLNPNWLNDQASTVSVPEGLLKRVKKIGTWNSINALVVDRTDLIKMKASAFSIRREETSKDWEDLQLLSPTKKEIEEAITFLKKHNSPPAGSDQKDTNNFKETIDDLRNIAE